MTTLADPSFGLDGVARAMLALLSEIPPTFAEFDKQRGEYDVHLQTRPFYEGLSGWVAIILHPHIEPHGDCKIVVFGEDFNSDNIIVQDWRTLDLKGGSVTPELQERDYDSYAFRPHDITKAVEHVVELLKGGYEDMREAEPRMTLMEALVEDD